jgi:hypothetical protein
LPEGEYLLRVTGLPASYYLKSITTDKTDLHRNPLTIGAADASVSVKATLGTSAGIKMSGRVTVAGRPGEVSSIKGMMLVGKIVDHVLETPLDPDGAFTLDKVLPGEYLARVTFSSNLAAPLVPVTIPEKDVRDVEIAVPGEIDVLGRVAVDGYGPPPKFSFLLIAGSTAGWSASKPGELPSVSPTALFTASRGIGSDGPQAVQLNVNPLPDGSFRMKLPEGIYRVAAAPGTSGVPAAYFLRSMTYGPADLLKESFSVLASEYAELQIGFGTAAPNPWARVSGRVKGFDPSKGPLRVALEGRSTSTIETPISFDGSFEFLRALQGTTYTARLIPPNDAASAPAVTVADKDVNGVEIVIPLEKEIRIVSTIEDGGAIPGFVMSFAGSQSSVTVIVKPERDGAFRAKLPADERRVRISGFPLGYVVKAATHGLTDLLKEPLKIGADDSSELKVTFAVDPGLPFGSLKGRVIGLDPQRSGIQLALQGVTSFSTFETPVSSEGSFSFSRIPQGAYVPALIGAGVSGLLSPSTIVVSGTDLFGIEINVPKQVSAAGRSSLDDAPTGVVVSNLSGSREAANESSALASLRTINTALVTYLSANGGRYGGISDLIQAGLLDNRFGGVVSGFNFSIIAVGTNYAAAAIPASAGTARYGYYSLQDAIIRYSTLDMLAPPRQSGNPVQ